MDDRRRTRSADGYTSLRDIGTPRSDGEVEAIQTPREDDGMAGLVDSYVRFDEMRVSSPASADRTEMLVDAALASTAPVDGAESMASTMSASMMSTSSGAPRSEQMARLFARNQTVEVLPRSQGGEKPTFQKPRPNSELFRTFTSSAPLNAHLRQHLLDDEAAEAGGVMPSDTVMTRPGMRDGQNRADMGGDARGMRRVPSLGSGLVRSPSWRVFYRNLPRALRFRQNTRSTTRYIDPSNAASLRTRIRAQREQAQRELSDDEGESAGMGFATPMARPQLGRQRSNFEDAGKYVDGSVGTPMTPHIPNGFDRTMSVNDNIQRASLNQPGRTSSLYSLESQFIAGKVKHKVVKINEDILRPSTLVSPTGEEPENGEPFFPSNEVKTSQYSWWSFVPVFIYLTFQKTANLYFLLVGIFQMIPDISPTDGVPLQFLPLGIVTVIDAVFAGYEDYKRHIADDQANSAPARVFNRELREFEDVMWRDIQVGDFVKIANHETIPADVLILAVIPAEGSRSGGNTGVCYVETKNLDGETNLKLREAPRATRQMFEAEEDAGETLHGYLESEMPNGDINRYSGTLYIEENESMNGRSSLKQASGVQDGDNEIGVPITLKNMLLRGSKLRNTTVAYGLVVNTGVDSKIMMSSGDEFPVKVSSIDEMTNKQVIIVVLLLMLMSLAGAVGDNQWLGNLNIPAEVDASEVSRSIPGTFVYFFTTLASMVPITLYVSITMVKALQAFFMERDIDMYDVENDVPLVARNMQLNEQLGQISHVFSDKTGTLTCNKMEFRKCSILGKSYGKGTTAIGLAARLRKDFKGPALDEASDDGEEDEYMKCPAPNVNFKDKRLWQDMAAGDLRAQKVRDFFRHLALCHGVLIERLDAQPDDVEMPPIVYSASSPDEQALVSGAKYFGFEFVNREPGNVSIKIPEGTTEQYEVLEVFEFDSTRKRMTVVVQKRKSDEELMQMTEDDEEEVLVLCKGADSVLFPRLSNSKENEENKETTLDHMEAFARDGLRTLVICSKVLKLHQWEEFHLRYRKACSDLVVVEAKAKGEPNAIDDLQDEMEHNLELLGATAIEDRLQDGVPETMERLAKAGICIWVLTGDMEETAINIGYACRLLNNDMQRHVINSANYHSKGSILRRLDKVFHWINEGTRPGQEDGDDNSSLTTETSNGGEHALVIDGACLNLVLEDPLYNLHLLRVALLCKVVVACRVSPQQKAQLVELVKLNVKDSHTLSIGDGANDVPMIQSAHIGVGISGQEGMQAVNSSDYAFGQFRYLSTLLLTHGRWNYDRVAGLTLYTFYKNIVYCMSMFWYCMRPSAYSGTMIYSAFIQQGYNLFFTALPIMAYAVFDRDLPKNVVLEYPALYHPATRQRKMFTYKMFWKWIVMAIIDSVGVYYFTLAAADNIMRHGESVEYTVLESMAWTTLCIVVTARFCLMVNSWDAFEVWSIVISIVALYLFQYIIDSITWTSPDYDTYSFPWIFARVQYWLGPLLAVVAIFAKEYFYEGCRRRFYPDYLDLVKEKMYLVNGGRDLEEGDEIKSVAPPMVSYMRPELVNMIDYRERRVQEQNPVRYAAPGREHLYSGFAFEQPAYIVNWILSTGNGGGISDAGPLRRKAMNPVVRNYILNSPDPVIFENERYQPFCGYGSTYPGYLLPTDRSRWSDRSGKISAMSIPLAGLELNLNAPGCDEDGWVYEVDFKAFPSSPPVRRRTETGEEIDEVAPPPKARQPSKKAIGPMRGFVRRRQWVLSERYKERLREREQAERAREQRQASL